MILSFRDRRTERFANGRRVPEFQEIEGRAAAKLNVLELATELEELRHPPGNRLEALTGDRAGQFSIRINNRWRICFEWTEEGPANVEIVDYHR